MSAPEGFVPDGFEPDSPDSVTINTKTYGRETLHPWLGPADHERWLNSVRKAAPTIAGTAASFIPIPGMQGARFAVPLLRALISGGAGAGAAAATGQDPMRAGIEQGGASLVGDAGSAALHGLGKAIAVDAYRVAKPLAKEFKTLLPKAIMENRIPIGGRFTQEGTAKAVALRKAAGKETARFLKAQGAVGKRIDPAATVAQLDGLIAEMEKTAGMEPQTNALRAMRDDFLAKNPGPWSPIAAKAEKRRYGQLGSKVLKNETTSGVPLALNERTMAQGHAAIEKGIRGEMERVLPARRLRELERTTRGRIALVRALQDVETARPPIWTDRILTPRVLLGPLGSPPAQSRLGFALSGPAARMLALYGPRVATLAADQIPMEDSPR